MPLIFQDPLKLLGQFHLPLTAFYLWHDQRDGWSDDGRAKLNRRRLACRGRLARQVKLNLRYGSWNFTEGWRLSEFFVRIYFVLPKWLINFFVVILVGFLKKAKIDYQTYKFLE